MTRYRKRPVEVEAYCFNQQINNYRPDWFQDAVTANEVVTHPGHALIFTLEGTMRANLGDWIIRGTKGELYPCKPDIFAEIYEAVE